LDASSLVAMMGTISPQHEFEGVSGQDQAQVMRCWVVAETDVETLDQTVDMVLAGVDDDE